MTDNVRIMLIVAFSMISIFALYGYFTYKITKSDNEVLALCVKETKQVHECELVIQGK